MMVQNLVTKRRHQNRTQQPGSLEYKAVFLGMFYILVPWHQLMVREGLNGKHRVNKLDSLLQSFSVSLIRPELIFLGTSLQGSVVQHTLGRTLV